MTTTTEAETPKVWDNGTAPHASLAEALAAFQAEVPKMSKDETAKVTGEGKNGPVKYTYGYAGLDQFVEIVEPVLGKHGLSVTSAPGFDEKGRYILTVTLLHESGEERSGIWPLPDPYGRGIGPQDLGSAYTYGRRYIAWGLTGTFPSGIDDDGKQAQQSARERWEDAQPRERNFPSATNTVSISDRQAQAGEEPQAAPAQQAPKTTWTDVEVLKMVKPMPTAALDSTIKVYDWMAGKNLHKRTVEMDYQGEPVKVTATDLVACRIADEAATEDASIADIKNLQALATNRGLMKVQVSNNETLAEALFTAQELAAHAESGQVDSNMRNGTE